LNDAQECEMDRKRASGAEAMLRRPAGRIKEGFDLMSAMDGKPMKVVARSVVDRDRDHLDSWKEIAAYLRREVRTERWERREGLPVHRHFHAKASSVCAFKDEIDAWLHSRSRAASEPASKEEYPVHATESLNPTLFAAAANAHQIAVMVAKPCLPADRRVVYVFYSRVKEIVPTANHTPGWDSRLSLCAGPILGEAIALLSL
jgi:hypothetical protein